MLSQHRGTGTSRLSGKEPDRIDRTGKGSRTKTIGTKAIKHEVVSGGLMENQRLRVFDAAPGTGTKNHTTG